MERTQGLTYLARRWVFWQTHSRSRSCTNSSFGYLPPASTQGKHFSPSRGGKRFRRPSKPIREWGARGKQAKTSHGDQNVRSDHQKNDPGWTVSRRKASTQTAGARIIRLPYRRRERGKREPKWASGDIVRGLIIWYRDARVWVDWMIKTRENSCGSNNLWQTVFEKREVEFMKGLIRKQRDKRPLVRRACKRRKSNSSSWSKSNRQTDFHAH